MPLIDNNVSMRIANLQRLYLVIQNATFSVIGVLSNSVK